MSCPCIKYDFKKNCEVCKISDLPIGVSLVCDFDYDTDCAVYKKYVEKKQRQRITEQQLKLDLTLIG